MFACPKIRSPALFEQNDPNKMRNYRWCAASDAIFPGGVANERAPTIRTTITRRRRDGAPAGPRRCVIRGEGYRRAGGRLSPIYTRNRIVKPVLSRTK